MPVTCFLANTYKVHTKCCDTGELTVVSTELWSEIRNKFSIMKGPFNKKICKTHLSKLLERLETKCIYNLLDLDNTCLGKNRRLTASDLEGLRPYLDHYENDEFCEFHLNEFKKKNSVENHSKIICSYKNCEVKDHLVQHSEAVSKFLEEKNKKNKNYVCPFNFYTKDSPIYFCRDHTSEMTNLYLSYKTRDVYVKKVEMFLPRNMKTQRMRKIVKRVTVICEKRKYFQSLIKSDGEGHSFYIRQLSFHTTILKDRLIEMKREKREVELNYLGFY